MLKVSLRSLLSHKLRLVLTALAIVIGVSSVAGTLIFIDTINATFTRIFQSANAGVAVEVRGHVLAGQTGSVGGSQRLPIPRALRATVQGVPGVQSAAGVIFRNGASLIGSDGKPIGGNGPPTFGGNWVGDPVLSPYHIRSGAPPSGPEDVVVDAGTASANKLSVGQQVKIAFQSAPEESFTMVATKFRPPAPANHDVRTTAAPGQASVSFSPASLVRP